MDSEESNTEDGFSPIFLNEEEYASVSNKDMVPKLYESTCYDYIFMRIPTRVLTDDYSLVKLRYLNPAIDWHWDIIETHRLITM